MTEGEYLAGEPWEMLGWLVEKGTARKKRLVGVACCRLIWDQVTDIRSRAAVEVAERYADGTASSEELEDAWEAAEKAFQNSPTRYDEAAHLAVTVVLGSEISRVWIRACVECSHILPGVWKDVIRCIMGNPFKAGQFDSSLRFWNGGAAVALAREMYETRDFGKAPLLADMLEDAGSSDPAILGHLRGPGPHARGCHVIDLLLGME